jgi:Ca-activated chloride channel family protein
MSEAPCVHPGLLWRGAPVPLEAVAIDVQVRPSGLQTVLSQRYRNSEPVPIEASYVFPLDETSAVCGFEVHVDGMRVVGAIADRERAFAFYDDALGDGHGAYLLDQEQPDVFTANLANLAPGSEIVVILTLVGELTWAGEDLRLVFPTALAPRYAPVDSRRGVGRTPAIALNPPRLARPAYGLAFSAQIDLGQVPRSIESPSHPITVELSGTDVRVTLAQRSVALDRDLVLVLRPHERPATRLFIEQHASGAGALQIALQPRFEAARVASEVVFLVDASTSMRGLSLAEARAALLLAVRALAPGDTFNIVAFGGTQRLLFPFSQPYDDATLLAASVFIQDLDAGQGGTELAQALEAVLGAAAHPGRPRQVFVFTDGQVTHTDEVLNVVRRAGSAARLFVFGLGSAPSSHLVRALARAGRGAAEFVAPGERAERKVLRQLERALAPALTDITIDWGALDVEEQAPRSIPVLSGGGHVCVHACVRRLTATVVTVRGRGPAGACEWRLDVQPSLCEPDEIVGRLAARAVIRDIEEGDSSLEDAAAPRLTTAGQALGAAARRAVLVERAMRYGLASSVTSFVAIEPRVLASEGLPAVRRVPTLITHGWGGRDRRAYVAPRQPPEPLGGVASPTPRPSPPGSYPPTAAATVPLEVDNSVELTPRHGAGVAYERRDVREERALERVVGLQMAAGYWEFAASLARAMGVSLRDLRARMPSHGGALDDAERAWATALVLCWLSSEWQGEHDVWGLSARKAQTWLDDCAAQPTGSDWLTAARQLAG